MRICIITDAWTPQVNGVVRTLRTTSQELAKLGHAVTIISPEQFSSLPCPTYPEIRLALASRRSVAARVAEAAPNAIHIATEGPLGVAARGWCIRHGRPFTTAYHTHFPDYLAKRTGVPASMFWRYIRWFHGPAEAVLAATPTVVRQLKSHGLAHTSLWGRGVDLDCFHPDGPHHPKLSALPRPIHLYVGRVAVEKNIEALLELDRPGSKVVVGDGPALASLRARYPDVLFTGALHGPELASAYRTADVFVFPSRTDTFGLVIVEALACGTPVAAYPVAGPIDILERTAGCMDADLGIATEAALQCDRADCARLGRRFDWASSARQFEAALVPATGLGQAGTG